MGKTVPYSMYSLEKEKGGRSHFEIVYEHVWVEGAQVKMGAQIGPWVCSVVLALVLSGGSVGAKSSGAMGA